MIDLKKSPGAPSCYYMTINEGYEKRQGDMYDVVNDRLHMVEAIGEYVWEKGLWTLSREEQITVAIDLVKMGAVDPVLVGKKGEGRADGKYPRLVSQVSVLNATEARAIFCDFLREEQLDGNCATAVALDLTTQEETLKMWKLFKTKGKLSSNDIQGYEWLFNEAMMNVATFARLIRMGILSYESNEWKVAAGKPRHLYAVVGHDFCRKYRVVQTPEGELFVTPAGQMSSGHYLTYSDNSFARAFLSDKVHRDHFKKPVSFVKTGGDDCVDKGLVPVACYSRYGMIVTDQQETDDEYSFCSTRFTKHGSYQENIGKALFGALIRGNISPTTMCSFVACFAKHPMYGKALEEIKSLPFVED